MAVYRQGYRRWEERAVVGRAWRWLAITRAGVALTGRSKWLRRFVLVAWLPLLYYALAFFLVGQLTDVSTLEKAEDLWQFQVLRGLFGGPLVDRFVSDPAAFRPLVWSLILHMFLRYTQVVSVMIVVAIVGPRLVSEDLRSRALALYFSKPLGRVDYVLGKLGVVGFWVAMVSFVPCLVLYGLSIAFSPSLETLAGTWHLVPRLLLYSLVLVLGTGAPMLALSALTPNPRFLGFLWTGGWVMSSVASTILHHALHPVWQKAPVERGLDWTGLVSFGANFDAISFALLEVGQRMGPVAEVSAEAKEWLAELELGHPWTWSLGLVLGLAALSLLTVSWRIGRPGEGGAR